jgi:ClpP class serine protease
LTRARFTKRGALALRPEAFGVELEVATATSDAQFTDVGGVAVVDICGPLTQHAEWIWDNYDSIKERVTAALESGARAVVMNIASPGGDVSGCFETSREIRALAQAKNVPLYAFVDGMAASAAYALACAASYIAVPPTGACGSIGVISTLFDQSAADEAAGLRWRIVTSGARKADGHPHVAISAETEAETQRHTDELAELFFALVAESRMLAVDAVRGLEARVFFGAKAVSAGLADSVMTKTALLAMVASGKAAASSGATGTSKGKTMDYDQLKADLESDAEGDDAKKAARAKRMLKALDDSADDADGDKADDSDAEGEGADSDAEGDNADSNADSDAEGEDAKKSKADGGDDQAKASAAVLERLGKVERELAAEKKKNAAAERKQLMAARPDLTKGQREYLSTLPLDQMKKALAIFPKPPADPAAAAKVTATRGANQGDDRSPRQPAAEAQSMRERMGLSIPKLSVKREANALVFPAMTPEEAKAAVTREGGAR